MNAIQMDFFKTPIECEMDALRLQLIAVKTSSDKVRRSLYARNNELEKRILDLEARLAILERYICHN